MSDGFEPPRGGFKAPRVPFDLRCVVLAALGYLFIKGADLLLAKIWGVTKPMAQLVGWIADQLGEIPFLGGGFRLAMNPLYGAGTFALSWWQGLVTALVFFLIWSFFGGAVLRTAGLRLTRDEPLTLREGLVFGWKNCLTFLLAPILVLLFAGFFTVANMLAGLLMSIPFVGSSLLALVLFPLTLLASILIVVSLIGGLVGLPLMWAGIAVEQNGALEALSRAFSYIFARPFRFFFSYFLIFVLMALIVLVAGHFETTAKTTLKAGIVRDSFSDLVSTAPADVDPVIQPAYLDADRPSREQAGIRDPRNVREASWWDWIGFLWMCLWINVFVLGFKGYALYFFLGGTASIYLQLRKDVDGTDEEEIFPASEEEWEAGGPKWVGGGGTPEAAKDAPAGDTPDAAQPDASGEEGPEPTAGE
jgi:hypothetical protein